MSSDTREAIHKTFEGEVVSDKSNCTVTVLVRKRVMHPLYKKYYTRGHRYKAHDAKNECKVGDIVRIMECKPISKLKNWRVTDILKRLG